MPEEQRIDAQRDLSPEGYELAAPLLEELATLEASWTSSEDEAAYGRWRDLLAEVQSIFKAHYVGGDELPGALRHGNDGQGGG